jgi:hypothetical protein
VTARVARPTSVVFPCERNIVDVTSLERSVHLIIAQPLPLASVMASAARAQGRRDGVETPPLPDFALVARSHHTLSTELAKCQNIPSLDNGAAILQAIQRLERRFDTMEMRLKAVLVEASLFISLRSVDLADCYMCSSQRFEQRRQAM